MAINRLDVFITVNGECPCSNTLVFAFGPPRIDGLSLRGTQPNAPSPPGTEFRLRYRGNAGNSLVTTENFTGRVICTDNGGDVHEFDSSIPVNIAVTCGGDDD